MQIDGGGSSGTNPPAPSAKLVVIHDQPQECPYLEDRIARMPLWMPIGKLDDAAMEELLELGYRRTGDFVYRTQCHGCQACEPTRVLVDMFQWSTSLRRVLRRGDQNLVTQMGPMVYDPQRLALFNRHRRLRSLDRGEPPVDEAGYRAFMVESCCQSFELSIRHADELVAVTVVDVSPRALSAVYTYFEPSLARFSLGTYAVLTLIRAAVRTGRPYVYLGMYVAKNQHLNYKARFVPQQRYIAGQWIDFTTRASDDEPG